MKHCVKYPDDKFLAVRPCLVAICFGNRPAAKLLGTLLYRYNLRVENKDDADNLNAIKESKGETPDQDTTYRIFRKQSQLVEDMCGEMTEKTMHDVAVPMLQLLGFIDLEEHMQSNCYIVNIDLVQQALNLYSPASHEQKQLETFLISIIQLEKFLITSDELETFLIDKKLFLSGLEKVLIYNRNVSNHKRGRKVKPEAVSRRVLRRPQNTKEITKKNNKKDISANADSARDNFSSQQKETENDTHSQFSPANVDKPSVNGDKPQKPKKPVIPLGPLVMPADDAKWCAETAVSIVEVKKGKRYSEVTRKQELAKATLVLRYEINGKPLTRAQFEQAWDDITAWPLWAEKNLEPMMRHLLKDDRIVTLLQRPVKVAGNGKQTPAVKAGYTDYTNSEPVKFIRFKDKEKARA